MSKSEILENLDYVKTLAKEGRTAPLIGGYIGLWWGVLLCLTLFAHWSITTDHLTFSDRYIGLLWMGFGIIGLIGSTILGRGLEKVSGSSSFNNHVASSLWTGNLIFLFVYAIAAGVSGGAEVDGFHVMNNMIPIAFGLYGITFYVLAQISGEKWQLAPGFFALVFMVVCLFLLNSASLFLVAIIGVICTIIIPDIIYIWNEPKAAV
jgi:hypothetical protein